MNSEWLKITKVVTGVVDLEKIALVKIVARLKDDGGQEDEEKHCGRKGFHL